MLYEVCINKYGTFTMITEYWVFADGHFEKSVMFKSIIKAIKKFGFGGSWGGGGVNANLLYIPE